MTQQKAAYPPDYSKTDASASQDRLDDMAAKATEQLGKVTENAQELAGQLAAQAQEAVKKFKPYVEKQMKEQPMATLAVAAAIGVLLGSMWKK